MSAPAYTIRRVGTTRDALGEGPVWDPVDGVLYWLDSRAPAIRRLDPASGAVETWPVPDMIGSMALRHSGGAVVALRNGFHLFDFDTGKTELIVDPEAADPRTRFNDGKCDRQGRFLAGTMAVKITGAALGSLYRLDPDFRVTRLFGDVIVANGPCFSPDGRTFYFSDTGRRRITAYPYDTAAGTVGEGRTLVDVSAFDSGPDGGTVDADGHVWSALVLSGQIGRFRPDGSLALLIDMPVRHPASVAFGGRDLDVLYVTSIADSGNLSDASPDAGGLFAIEGLGIRGLAEPRFAG